MISDPIDTQRDCDGLKGIIGKTVLRTQGRKGGAAFCFLTQRDSPCFLPRGGIAHALETSVAFREDGIIELPTRFEMAPNAFGGSLVGFERQFDQKGRGLLSRLCLRFWLGWLLPLRLFHAHSL